MLRVGVSEVVVEIVSVVSVEPVASSDVDCSVVVVVVVVDVVVTVVVVVVVMVVVVIVG